MKAHITLMVVALLGVGSLAGQEEAVTSLDRFKLWTECKPVELLVGVFPDDATAIGLAEEDVSVAARSRLRAARIYTSHSVDYWIYISVNIAGSAYSVRIEFHKRLEDLASGRSGLAATWISASAGTHGKTGKSHILSVLYGHIDKFIDDYLRVNAEACS